MRAARLACATLVLAGTAASAGTSTAFQDGRSQEKTMPKGYQDFTLAEGRFRCAIPKGWTVSRDRSRDDRQGIFGVLALGPREAGGVAARISVDYYARDNKLFPSAADFLKRQLGPRTVELAGEKTGAVEETRVAGLPAKRFSRRTFEYLPPHSAKTREIPVREERVVLEHQGGFYVLSMTSSPSGYKKHGRHFDQLLRSFQPLPPAGP